MSKEKNWKDKFIGTDITIPKGYGYNTTYPYISFKRADKELHGKVISFRNSIVYVELDSGERVSTTDGILQALNKDYYETKI